MPLTIQQIENVSELRSSMSVYNMNHPDRRTIFPELRVRIAENGDIVHAGQYDRSTGMVHITEYAGWWELWRLELV